MSFLSPLDLLGVPDNEQDIFRVLSKTPKQTIPEIAKATKLSVEEVENILTEMLSQSRVVEQLQDGQRRFSVRFGNQKRQIRNLPSDLLDIFEQSTDTLLAEMPLTSVLTPKEREELLAQSVTLVLMVDEVYQWQGNRVEQVALIKSGLLKGVRLRGKQALQVGGYVHSREWLGLSLALSEVPSPYTYTAVTESELLVWPLQTFINFVGKHQKLSEAIMRRLSYQYNTCQSQQVQGLGKLWVIEEDERQGGSTRLAANLSILTAQSDLSGVSRSRTVLWYLPHSLKHLQRAMPLKTSPPRIAGKRVLQQHDSGVDILLQTERTDYSPQVQLDIILTQLQSQYDYIICDTGHETKDELTLRLRGQAETLITVTEDTRAAERATSRWNRLQPYTRPGQKRLLVLDQADPKQPIDAAFHIILPKDEALHQQAQTAHLPLIQTDPQSPLSQAYQEVYRRLSLTHTIGIFIPSTLEVDEVVDNAKQVQSTLSFLGKVFGGATSSEAEGVWRSEDKGLVTEQVTIVRAFVSQELMDQHLDEVITFASRLKEEMSQEAVAVDVDNQLILV